MRANEDAEGINSSFEYLSGLIQQEIDAGIPADRIAIGGFSQGGAMSIYTGLMSKVKLAGIVSLSGWLLLSKTFHELYSTGPKLNDNTPIFSNFPPSVRSFNRAGSHTCYFRLLTEDCCSGTGRE